jgi:hypothetical protein
MRTDANKDFKIKIDFNLLMSGTWVLEKRGNRTVHKFEKNLGNGKVIIYNALAVPSTLDSKVLDFLMLKAQENDWQKEISTGSLRQVAKEIGMGVDRRRLNRLKRSFKILANTRIEFHNCFIDTGVMKHFEGTFDIVDIGILSGYSLKRIRARGNPIVVKVVFDDNFINLCKYSLGYKLIPYTPINGLRDTAYALYKWAWRWYDSDKGYGERWIGEGKKLVEWYKNELNSTGNYKYPSEVLRRIKSAIKQLNEHVEVPFSFSLIEENKAYKIEISSKKKIICRGRCPFDSLPSILQKIIIKLLDKKGEVENSIALARSLTRAELNNLLEGVLIIQVPKDIWSFIVNDIIVNADNIAEKKEFEKALLTADNAGNNILAAFKEVHLKKRKLISTLFDIFLPNWESLVKKAQTLLEESISRGVI